MSELSVISKNSANILFLHIEANTNDLSIYAEIGTENKHYQVKGLNKIKALYDLLQNNQINSSELLSDLGFEFYQPIISFIDLSSEINFVISENLLKLPLDILYFKGLPLCIQKPIIYSFVKLNSPNMKLTKKLSALIISDKTADPENGTYLLKKLLPYAKYYDINDINLTKLDSMRKKDIILISAHGKISFDSNDFIKLGGFEQIFPHNLSRLVPKLVYLDSCQLGVSNAFIQNFRKVGTNYFLAPIISNEAGNSSTKTIEFFFRAFEKGNSPAVALFLARTKLYRYFEATDYFESLLWRAFPFRIYLLN